MKILKRVTVQMILALLVAHTVAPRAIAAGWQIGLPYEECLRQENASDLSMKLTAIPDSDTNQKMRGIIVVLDFLIQTYSQCLPDQRVQQGIDQYQTKRDAMLRRCRQYSSADNCLEPPSSFGLVGQSAVDDPKVLGGWYRP